LQSTRIPSPPLRLIRHTTIDDYSSANGIGCPLTAPSLGQEAKRVQEREGERKKRERARLVRGAKLDRDRVQ